MGNTTENTKEFELLDAFLNNIEKPIREFYVSEYPKTKRYILAKGGSIDNVNDVFQEAFFSCWKKLGSGKFIPNNREEIEAYLFTTAKNKWIDQLRIQMKNKTISMDDSYYQLRETEPEALIEHHEDEQKLNLTLTAFEKLGQPCKNLLAQFYYQKMSLREIAEGLQIEEASAKNKKYRCIQKLKELALNKELSR